MRILVVEDDRAVTQLLEAALDARGASVTIAESASDLDRALGEGSYDVALLDLSPIASDPAGAIAKLRTSSPAIRVVLISGSADALPESVTRAASDLVRKPFEVREVVAALAARRVDDA